MAIDDERGILELIQRALRRDFEVLVFDDPEDALAALRSGVRVDGILCDLMMSPVSGMEVWKALLQLAPPLAETLVLVTAGAMSEEANQFLAEWPRARRVLKPFSAAILVATVQRALAPASPR